MHTQSHILKSRRKAQPLIRLTDTFCEEAVTFIAGCYGIAAIAVIFLGLCG